MRKTLLLLASLWLSAAAKPALGEFIICEPAGWEERGPQWVKWLASSVRVNGASGTMCYHDQVGNWVYVITAGHLFDKVIERKKATVDVFYSGLQKLSRPRRYTGEVLASVFNHDPNNHHAYDVAMVRFRPDIPNPYITPIAPKGYQLESGRYYHSVGCDNSTEPAHYLAQYWYDDPIGNSMTQVITKGDYPRGGRSGGGVLTDDGYLVFICSRRHGEGFNGGSWTSLNQIYVFLESTGYTFVTNHMLAKRKKIIDLDFGTIGPEFILVPFGARN